ncbi:hypothetical protein OG738_39470 [Amycolatopsis sp. NBC_01488]|nr:hypothetical protein [Amycolatopsis sp. NBC_01488]
MPASRARRSGKCRYSVPTPTPVLIEQRGEAALAGTSLSLP